MTVYTCGTNVAPARGRAPELPWMRSRETSADLRIGAESGRRESNPHDQLGRLVSYSGRLFQLASVNREYSVSIPARGSLGRNLG